MTQINPWDVIVGNAFQLIKDGLERLETDGRKRQMTEQERREHLYTCAHFRDALLILSPAYSVDPHERADNWRRIIRFMEMQVRTAERYASGELTAKEGGE